MTKPLKFWSVTVSCNFMELPEVSRIREVLDEFSKQWCFQLEKGANKGKLHYQCRIILAEAQKKDTMLTIFSCRFQDMRDITFLPESNNSIVQGGLAFYVLKDETRVDGPWYDPTYVPRRRNLYKGEDLDCMKEPRPFQKTIIDAVCEPPDDRTINWIVNVLGCTGKSKLMKYLRMNPQCFDFARVPLGTATQIKTSVIAKGSRRIYMVDLPRVRGSDERQQELFSALEEIKNGWVESPMYGKTDELLMMPPHVWVFSNEAPNLNFASPDRWRVWTIDENNNLVPYEFPVIDDQFDD